MTFQQLHILYVIIRVQIQAINNSNQILPKIKIDRKYNLSQVWQIIKTKDAIQGTYIRHKLKNKLSIQNLIATYQGKR